MAEPVKPMVSWLILFWVVCFVFLVVVLVVFRILCARSSSSLLVGVRSTWCVVWWSSLMLSLVLSWWICWESGGWAMWRWLVVRLKCCSLVMVMKVWRWCSFISGAVLLWFVGLLWFGVLFDIFGCC